MNYWGVVNKKTSKLELCFDNYELYSNRQSARDIANDINSHEYDNKVTVKKVLITVID